MVTLMEATGPAGFAGLCLHDWIDRQASQTPDADAVVFEGTRLSYRELVRRANRLADHLAASGVGVESRVALFVERSAEMVVSMLGILKAGGAYVPIDPATPAERVSYVLDDSGAQAIITDRSLADRLPSAGPEVVVLDSLDWAGNPREAARDRKVQPGNLAYVIYTSGSTGRPKGVAVEHRNVVSYLESVIERYGLRPGMKYAMVSTVAADLCITAVFPPLVTGGSVHVVSREMSTSQSHLSEYFGREQIDVLKIVPSHLAALQTGKDPERVLPREMLVVGGEPSRNDWVARLREMAPACRIYNEFGPTETTVGVLTYLAGSSLPETRSGTLPLGTPLPNSAVYLLDDHGDPVEDGEEGELCIGGSCVARGYHNRPELTDERFVPDTFARDPGAKMYRTGDRAVRLQNGELDFLGRIDDQVKISGYRVELGEIEGILRDHHLVQDVVVLLRGEEAGGKQLVAFVVPSTTDGRVQLESALRAHLQAQVPSYMIPAAFAFLEQLPLNPNGKVDRQGLLAVAVSAPPGEEEFVAPATETERALADIWARLLNTDRIGRHDDFFESGGDSLKSIGLVSWVHDAFGVDLPIGSLFEQPTLIALAERIDALRWVGEDTQAVHPESTEREEFEV